MDTRTSADGYVILFVGPQWFGSDSRALAVALRQLGHGVITVDEDDFYSHHWRSLPLRMVRRLGRGLMAREFNQAVRRQGSGTTPDFVLAFKGMLLEPATLAHFRERGVPCYLFYPDVSFREHDPRIARCLPLYDCVFTTKPFHLDNAWLRGRTAHLERVRHGADPDVHRPLRVTAAQRAAYAADVAFVGCWSPGKERQIRVVLEGVAGVRLRIWGPGWNRADARVRACWERRCVYGDELSLVYQCAAVNLGLLSEAGIDTDVGDTTTARTWQVPASGGFLLHPSTPELCECFVPGREVGVYTGDADLVGQVRRYLAAGGEREQIARAGRARCEACDYTYRPAAARICRHHAERQTVFGVGKTEERL